MTAAHVNGTGTIATAPFTATLGNSLCPCDELKEGRRLKEEGEAMVKQGEILIAQALARFEALKGGGIAEPHSHVITAPVATTTTQNSIEVIEQPKKTTVVNKRGVKISTKECQTRVLNFVKQATKDGNQWIGMQTIQKGAGLGAGTAKRGIDALVKNKQLKKVEKAGNPIYKGNWRNENKKHPYFELR